MRSSHAHRALGTGRPPAGDPAGARAAAASLARELKAWLKRRRREARRAGAYLKETTGRGRKAARYFGR
jgi:hypothetical protein